VLSRYPAVALHLALLLVAAVLVSGCSLPISMPLASKGSLDEPELITGSIPTEVNDTGVAERIGASAWAALKSALVSAAEIGQDGETFAWKSAGSGDDLPVEGTVTTVNAFFDEDGAVCRRLAITAVAYTRTDTFVADACRKDGGGWNVRPSRESAT